LSLNNIPTGRLSKAESCSSVGRHLQSGNSFCARYSGPGEQTYRKLKGIDGSALMPEAKVNIIFTMLTTGDMLSCTTFLAGEPGDIRFTQQ